MEPNAKGLGFVTLPTISTPKDIVSLLASVIAARLLLRTFYTTILYPELFTPLKHIPTPAGRSLGKGTTAPSQKSHAARLRYWSKTVPNNGLIRYYLPGNQERVLVTSPKALAEILVAHPTDFTKPKATRERLWYITGRGLLLAEGEEHKIQRKSLVPAFSFRHVKDLYPVFWSKARELTDSLEKEIKKAPAKATRATLDIIGVAGMNHDFDALHDPDNLLNRQYRRLRQEPSWIEVLCSFVTSLLSPKDASIVSQLPTSRKREVKEASDYIRSVCRSIIQEKREKSESDQTTSEVDIIAVALKSGVFTDANLVDQMMTFLAAGHGTTSHALQWAVHVLCKHGQIQTRLRQEVRDNLPSITDSESTISATELDRLPYLHAFCNELLRFYPPVPITVREALHDMTVAGQRIPKGTTFTIAPGVTNLDEQLWGPDAGKFDPERWMQKGCANTGGVQNHLGFLTFLHGPRSCIGATFARSELACLVAALVGRFRLELEDPNKEVEPTQRGIGAAPVDGVRTRLEVVDGW
ncbi:cytochrome P450 oxidoreductase [Capronia epimyces CBS 606.96]|uniref:Cytochrome P450 oxidoreductase n=1 Tax=Capronia epimyces CBS 606.96 TaxID=1182542 RepID=W9XKW8_9EURO|nr:cytochrome P450 oxidoreductase [Capronia epimyces CBS 606.96]EXJ80828.1 cytochrome P450 oxidoreductase [Capronia epimyces CBS 606.96]